MLILQGALDWHPAPKPVLEAAIEARKKAAAQGVDIGTLAIKEAVKPKGIAVNLIGMRMPDEVSLACIRMAFEAQPLLFSLIRLAACPF